MSLGWLSESIQYNDLPTESPFDSSKRCRTCLSESQHTFSLEKDILFEEYGTNLTIVQLVQECASVEISLGDAKPQSICQACIDSVSQFYIFRKRCQFSQTVLAQEFKTEASIKQEDELFEEQYSDEPPRVHRKKRKYKRRKLKREDTQDSFQDCSNMVKIRIEESFEDVVPSIDDGFSSDEDDEPLSVISKKHKAQILSDEFTKCDLCNKTLKTHIALIRHRKRHERRYMEIIKAKSSLEQRRPTHERTCEYCGKVYKYRHYMLKHVQRTHAKINPELKNPPRKLKKSVEERTCDVCGKTYVDRKVMLTHKRRFHFKKDRDIAFKSEFDVIDVSTESKQLSQSQSEQAQAQSQVPIQPGALFCAYCDWTGSLGDLVKHRIAEHSHLKEWKCDHCGKMFFTKASKEVHQLVHTGEKQHVCELCGGSFAIKSNLERHRRTHTGEKPYKCTRCDKSFAQSSALILHGQTHTKDRKFVCNVCGKSYHLQSTLRVHMKKHQPVDQWLKCSMCEKRFSDRKFLRQHMVVHTGERNHKCPICDKGFGRESSMRTHMKIHTGDKTSTSAATSISAAVSRQSFSPRNNYYPTAVVAAPNNPPAL